MKKIGILLAILCLGTCAWAENGWKETRNVIFQPNNSTKVQLLRPDESVQAIVKLTQTNVPTHKYLRVVGNIQMPAPFEHRGEEMFRRAEYLIDDNLDSLVRKQDTYSLYFKGNGEAFERYAYYRIEQKQFKPGRLEIQVPVVRQNKLNILPSGEFGIELEVFYNKPGRAAEDIYDAPDSLLFMPIPAGTSDYREVKQSFLLPENVACILLRVGGYLFSGECWVEAPRLYQEGKQIAQIPFVKHAQRTDEKNYWVGVNLATRSWPRWSLKRNGQLIFEGNIFDRASNVADFYIPLPADTKPGDQLELSLRKEAHRAAFPYELRSIEVIEETARPFEVISVPRFVRQESEFGVLVETNQPNVRLQVQAKGSKPSEQIIEFANEGLHVVQLRADEAGQSIPLSFESAGQVIRDTVCQVIAQTGTPVYISSGDEIYMDKEYGIYDYFFKWYVSQRVGNWYQFRPSYQWSGFRMADPEVIRHYVLLLDQLKMPYAWQVEGRTLASTQINPSLETLRTPMFRGKQAHENDGGYYYWQHFKYQGLFSDMAARTRPYGGIFAKHRPIYTDHGTFIHYDTQGVKDMADGAQTFIANVRSSKGESTRHTGPSTLFRYLYQAGYEWLGAEQMYGPEEVILSALRGASLAYSRPTYGTLHAMQWGSGPFTDPRHALRLYLSLAIAYMHGSSHLNTEEALWTDEYANDRYTKSGREHLYAQHQMLDFLETHSRRGTLTSRVAVVQGKNDAWKSFGRGPLWSQEGDKWKFNAACESFDLLKVFYPDNIIDGCSPEGWFTTTPYGTIDLLPIEAPQDVMDHYRALIFLGWNTYDADYFEHIRKYVFNGGTLLLSAAHLNEELQPDVPTRFPKDDALIRELLGEDYASLTQKAEIPYGLGKVIYFPQKAYPAEECLREAYQAEMEKIAQEAIASEPEKGWIAPSPEIGFTAWDDAGRRTLYLLNTDWQSDAELHNATFIYGEKQFTVPVRRYHIENIHCAQGLALRPEANTSDVLSMDKTDDGWKVRVQTTGKDTLHWMNAQTGATGDLAITDAGIHELVIK